MRIALVNPPVLRTNDSALLKEKGDSDASAVSIGLYSLAALLIENEFDARLLNHARKIWKDCVDEIAALEPDLLGIACMTHNRAAALGLAEAVKKRLPRCRTILGGVHPSFLHQEILERCPAVDFVAVGEAETSLLELARRLETGDAPRGIPGIAGRFEDGSLDWPGPAEPVPDLGALPVPARHFAYDIIATSRGCPYNCTFCCSPALWGSRVRERPVGHVLEELELLRRKHGFTTVYFKDETFTARKSRVIEICRAMIERNLNLWWTCDTRADCLDEERLYWMRKAGCYYVSFGVESGSPRMLKALNKRAAPEKVREATRLARRFGMIVRYYLIAGLPDETEADVRATIKTVRENRPGHVFLSTLSVSPGTELFRQYRERFGADNSLWFENKESNIWFDPEMRWAETKTGRELRSLVTVVLDGSRLKQAYPLTEEELRAARERIEDGFAPNYDLAVFLKEKERWGEAAPLYERALALRPDFSKGWLDFGQCLLNLGRTDEALEKWSVVETLEDEPAENRAIALLYRGIAAGARGQTDEALALWRRAHELQPRAADPLLEIALKCAETGRWEEAVEAAEKLVEIAPDCAQGWHVLGLGGFFRGLARESQLFFEKALQLDPANPEIYCNYAVLMSSTGHPADAAKLLESCLRVRPDYARAREMLARLRGAAQTEAS